MNIRKQIKKLLGASVLGAILVGVVSASGAVAAGPRFNFLSGDREFTVARTQSQTAYSDPLAVKASDKVTVAVYYHNGIQDTTANNVRVKILLPTSSSAQHVVKTTLWADNADAITDTVVNGSIVGNKDLTFNLDSAAAISYVPGSTLWYPDLNANPNETGVKMSDDIISANGLNIGNIEGCWDHAGYVLFDLNFAQHPVLVTDKLVGLFGGNNQWVKENTANMGDQLRYQIYYNNTGNANANNAKIVDTLPAEVSYQPGSVVKRVKDANNNDVDIDIPDSSITFNGQTMTIPLGTVAPGQQNSGYVYMRVKVKTGLAVGTHNLINNETVKADSVADVSSSAKTVVVVNEVLTPDVKILKEVVNVTQGGSRWVKENTAKPGDKLEYRLTIYNQGNAVAQNVSVKDVLPQYVSYVAGSTKLYNADPNSGQTIPDGITAAGVNIGTVANGVPTGNRYITFDVTVNGNVPTGNTDLINTGNVYLADVLKDTSTAKTTVTAEVGLLLTKQIWDSATAQWVNSLDNVKPGETLTFRIQVRNTGNTTVYNPNIKDVLPNLVTYIPGSTRMDGSVTVNDAWIVNGSGILIANVTAGNFKTITFQVRAASCPPGGSNHQINTATVIADGIALKTATAEFNIVATAPGIPR